ncbi:MAG: c-type cytochrome [Candidatus Elarobacter sp.]
MQRRNRWGAAAAVLALASLALIGCSLKAEDPTRLAAAATPAVSAGVAGSPRPIPSGSYGELIRYGQNIIQHTRKVMPANVGAALTCESCHLSAGTKPHGGSLIGAYIQFPQWNARSKRFIALEDRLAECYLYSMNGRPPAYTSREMVALTAYIAWLSNGQAVGSKPEGRALITFAPDRAPDPHIGQAVYAQKCAACHGATGAGSASFPPLWGDRSFNDGAGMHRLSTMAAFARYNMPFGGPPNTLSKQAAYDVSAFVLSHSRPHFATSRKIAFPALPAGFF